MANSELLMLFRELMKTPKKPSRGKKVSQQRRHGPPTATSSVPTHFLLLQREKRTKSAEKMSSRAVFLVSVFGLQELLVALWGLDLLCVRVCGGVYCHL